jgi:PAS domain S-box-containing protein
MYRIYEQDESEPITHASAHARVHPDDLAMYMEQEAKALREASETDFQVRLQFPNGSIKHIHVVAHPARSDSGELEYTGAVQDITDRRRAEDALAKLRTELAHVARVSTLGALTASIAHEVNQPVSGILLNASVCLRKLADHPPDLEGARETARRTIRDARRTSEVVARLRALFAKKETTAEPVDLNDAAREVTALMLSDLQRNRVALHSELADDLPTIIGDRIQLQQVILNLLLNASQAMRHVDDRPRELIIRTERDDGEGVRLTVHDVGVGFDPQDADRLFEAFYTTKTGGMGIGLSVSRTIIESHGGHLSATLNDGPGATFTFTIPYRSKNLIDSYRSDAIRTDGMSVVRTS